MKRTESVDFLGVWIQMVLLENDGLHVEQRNMDVEKQRLEDMVAQETEGVLHPNL